MTTDTDAPLSSRVRPNSEAAPWVVAAIKALERRAERAEGLLREAAQEGGPWDVESWVKRVAAHFDAVGRKP